MDAFLIFTMPSNSSSGFWNIAVPSVYAAVSADDTIAFCFRWMLPCGTVAFISYVAVFLAMYGATCSARRERLPLALPFAFSGIVGHLLCRTSIRQWTQRRAEERNGVRSDVVCLQRPLQPRHRPALRPDGGNALAPRPAPFRTPAVNRDAPGWTRNGSALCRR